MRKIILHYHLYKNAGSSIDQILKSSLGDSWQNFDRDLAGHKILPGDMQQFIEFNPQLKAVSSHQAVPPLPVGDFEMYPIVFIRHPILRVRSAYVFEWQKQLGLNNPKGSFKQYLEEKLKPKKIGGLSNFHVSRLSNIYYKENVGNLKKDPQLMLERAKLFLDNCPYFGLVEQFEESLTRLHYYLRVAFPEVSVRHYEANVLQGTDVAIDSRLKTIQMELGASLYKDLLAANQLDLELYDYATYLFNNIPPRR